MYLLRLYPLRRTTRHRVQQNLYGTVVCVDVTCFGRICDFIGLLNALKRTVTQGCIFQTRGTVSLKKVFVSFFYVKKQENQNEFEDII